MSGISNLVEQNSMETELITLGLKKGVAVNHNKKGASPSFALSEILRVALFYEGSVANK